MSEDFETHLEKIHFEKYLKKLQKKLQNKKIIIYGAGSLFQYIKQHYDLSSLNIIGISDMKFSQEQENEEFLGYKIIPKDNMFYYNPDCILIATLQYNGILENFVLNVFNNTKTKVYPLAKKPLLEMIREIWKR